MTANPAISLAHRANVDWSCVIVLLKLMYLNIYKKNKNHINLEEILSSTFGTTIFDPQLISDDVILHNDLLVLFKRWQKILEEPYGKYIKYILP